MNNELILLIHIALIAIAVLIAKRIGQHALIAFTALGMVLANLFVVKQITLCGMTATAADALAIGSMLGLNLLQEFFGKESARSAIVVTFFLSLFFAAMSFIHLAYAPSLTDSMHEHFVSILSPAPALVAGSIAIYLLSQCIDYAIYGFLNTAWNTRFLIMRNYIAIGVSQLIDTALFSLLLSYLGLIESIISVIAISFTIKLSITLIATPLIAFASRSQDCP